MDIHRQTTVSKVVERHLWKAAGIAFFDVIFFSTFFSRGRKRPPPKAVVDEWN